MHIRLLDSIVFFLPVWIRLLLYDNSWPARSLVKFFFDLANMFGACICLDRIVGLWPARSLAFFLCGRACYSQHVLLIFFTFNFVYVTTQT
jgi:hypothetical protein